FFSSRRRHTRSKRDWSSDVCSSDLAGLDPRIRPARRGDARRQQGGPHGVPDDGGLVEYADRVLRVIAPCGPCFGAEFRGVELLRSEERRVGKEGGWRGTLGRRRQDG